LAAETANQNYKTTGEYLLKEVAPKVVTALLTATGFLGLVAFTGGAIAWVRFAAAKLPADQAVAVMPNSELLVLGAAALAVFVPLALLAVLVVFLIDRAGRPTVPMPYALLVLAVLEIVVVVASSFGDEDVSWWEPAGVIGAVVFLGGAAAGVFLRLRETGSKVPRDKPREKSEADVPERFELTERGWAFLGVIIVATVAVGWLGINWWIGVAIAVAWILALATFGVAAATSTRFLWYGAAVFFSVVLYGAIANVLKSLSDPEVQPAALVRLGDAQREGLKGIYVTEGDDRIYLGSVAIECDHEKKLAPDSGRMFWVPTDQVVSLMVGPPQGVKAAKGKATRMLRQLRTIRRPQVNPETGDVIKPTSTATVAARAGAHKIKKLSPAGTPPALRDGCEDL